MSVAAFAIIMKKQMKIPWSFSNVVCIYCLIFFTACICSIQVTHMSLWTVISSSCQDRAAEELRI
jgi:hypothetical protein